MPPRVVPPPLPRRRRESRGWEGEGGAATTSGGGLCARYVEEILAVLVTGGVVRLADAAADGDGGDATTADDTGDGRATARGDAAGRRM